MNTDDALRYRPLELATGIIFGEVTEPLPTLARRRSPRAALEDVAREALLRPPCIVSFSGGRDSSAVLAVATHVAKDEGLPLPVPVSLRVSGAPEADETEWQELVIQHLGLPDWQIIDATSGFDIVGDLARRVHARCGLIAPFNLHLHEPMVQLAAGGAVLTGGGGDEVMRGRRRAVLANAVYAHRRPRRSEFRRLLQEVAPAYVRVRREIPTSALRELSWLTKPAREEFCREYRALHAGYPLAWDETVRIWAGRRVRQQLFGAFARLGAGHDCVVHHPFASDEFLDAAARHFGQLGPPSRTVAMETVSADLLPRRVLERRSKATFNRIFFTEVSRAAAAAWDGCGLDEQFVDADSLATAWTAPDPEATSYALLQHVVFEGSKLEREQLVDRRCQRGRLLWSL